MERAWLLRLLAVVAGLGSSLPGSALFAAQKPHLLVVVVAEQFRSDYLDSYRSGFSPGGFKRLLADGSVFHRSRYDHLTTLAAPNAAVLATGGYPELHGIVGNWWYDRETRQVVEAVRPPLDPRQLAVPGAAGPSPEHLIGSTFADQLHLSSGGKSRVVAVSDQPAPAILMAGRKPAGCFWMKPDGRFETSSFYPQGEPEWVQVFNESHSIMRFDGTLWVALDAQPGATPLRVIELKPPKNRQNFLALYHASPFALEDTFEFAKRAVEVEKLGAGDYPDLLIVNLSATALLGLETGARSPLMRDLVLRLDRQLAGFLDWLDGRLGLQKVSFVFTAIHGMPPLPQEAQEQGLAAGRIRGEELVETMNAALRSRFGANIYVDKYLYPFVYLNSRAHRAAGARRRDFIDAAGDAALRLPGVAGYYNPESNRGSDSLRRKFQRSFHPPRSGDFLIAYEPYFVEYYDQGRGTTSGSFYRYDTDVPLIFFGNGFRKRHFQRDVDAASLAPTLAALLDIPAPSSATGRVLAEVLLPSEPPAPRVSRGTPPSPH